MIHKSDLLEIQKEIERGGANLARMILELDIPPEYKDILIGKIIDLADNPEEMIKFSEKILEEFLFEKVLENDEEYQKEIEEINKETEEDIKKIFND